MAASLILAPVVGRFVIASEDADYVKDAEGLIQWTAEGEAVTTEKYPIYFEQSLGDDKAKYWTKDLDKAFVFKSVDEATRMLLKLKKPEDCQIMALAEQPENATV